MSDPAAPSPKPAPCCGRLLRRASVWVPTWRGWLVVLALGATALYSLRSLHGFLSVNAPVEASILVAEGWLPDYGLDQARQEFERGHYRLVLTSGGPIERGHALSEYKNYAELAAATLRRSGLTEARVRAVPARFARQDRTYTSAVAVWDWLKKSEPSTKAINVVSEGPHARRTRLLYERALGPGIIVGIIPVEDRDYDPRAWWKSSEGVKQVLTEAIGYLYARFLFHPAREPATNR